MKKIISLILALMLVLCMGAAAFADEAGDTTTTTPSLEDVQDKGPTVSKTYKANNGTAPAEDFIFTFEGVSYKGTDGNIVANATIPSISNVTIHFNAQTGELTSTEDAFVDADDYNLGVYTYKVTEVVPTTKTTGVTYSTENLYLVLTILRDEQSEKHYVAAMHYQTVTGAKSAGFTNEYDSGSLTVTKKIAGNMADMNKKFAFTITFTAPAGTEIKSAISSNSENGTWSEDNLTYTISLGHNESVTLSNIPAGTTYTVTEDAENYTSDGGVFDDTTKTISANDRDSVTFTNTLTSEIDMGVSTDSLPYIVLLGIVALIGAAMIIKRRATND